MASHVSPPPSDTPPPLPRGGRRLFLIAFLWLLVGASPGQAQTDDWGPAHEVRQGTGSGGQSSVIPLLGRKQEAQELWIRWPGGREQSVPLPPTGTTVRVAAP